jgi:hypothetical protein
MSGNTNYKTFNGKRYRAHQEYTVKSEAKRDQAKFKDRGYLARIVYSKWARMYILYVRINPKHHR